jgi:membrane protease YdiL (CAAX protease family)
MRDRMLSSGFLGAIRRESKRIRMRRVALFLSLTFALSWGFDLIMAAGVGSQAYFSLGMTPFGMLIPAFVALALQLFVFRDSPIYCQRCERGPRYALFGFLGLTPAYGAVTVLAVAVPGASRVFVGLGSLLLTLWTLLLFYAGGQSDAGAFRHAGLQLGDTERGQRFALGIIAFFALQAGLNLLLGLGELHGRADGIYGVPIPAGVYPLALTVSFVAVTVIGLPLSGLAAVFGEEYGWRGFLQGELVRLGRLPGVFLVGLVWGVWHLPLILRGVHTYPPTGLGLVLGLVFFILWGFVQSYAVFKTGSIWVASFMHGLVNSVYAFMLTYAVRPADNVLSFGLGVYGLACLAVVVLVILRDPAWKTRADQVLLPER